ncbi:hypothetical protein [uncultured Lentibacter sp.]|jgi:hypothetical protein|uniref:hypothetical protein n=1 Tax=uncultured Lentibacter sp. TaxID=1659309 RepID=UPI0026331502|nr:hypothetical protein [uncultured Lentibacter sp.]
MKSKLILGAAFAALMGTPALAGDLMPAYPYSGENNCPTGLSPIVMGGVICCGTPNQEVSYSSMMAEPAPRKRYKARTVRYLPRDTCIEGEKGCS